MTTPMLTRTVKARSRFISAPSWAFASMILLALAAIAFGSHVLHGGLYRDDWRFWLEYATAKPGLGGAVHAFHWMWFRPLQMLWWPAIEAALGPHPAAQIAFTVALAVAASVLLFQLLTLVGLGRIAAAVVAALVLLFPASDATRLWPAANVASAALALYLLGAMLSLRAFERRDGRALLDHVGGVLLYLTSLALYEVAVPAMLASILLYRLRISWRRAAARWIVDLAALVPFIVLVTSHSSRLYPRSHLSAVPSHAKLFAGEALTLLSRAIVPFGSPKHLTGVIIVAGVAALGAVRMLTLRDREQRAELGRWLLALGAGALLIAAGYAPYLLSDVFEPLAGGLSNRVNVLPSIGFALVVWSLIMIAVKSVVPGEKLALGAALSGAAAVAVAVGYTIEVRDDVHVWDQAATLQRQTVNEVVRLLDGEQPGGGLPGALRRGSIFVFDQYAFTAPGVPVFNESDDLDAALKARLGNYGQHAYPALRGAFYYCQKWGLWMDTSEVTLDDDYGSVDVANFGHTVFIDVRRRRLARISSEQGCNAALTSYLPDPLLPGT